MICASALHASASRAGVEGGVEADVVSRFVYRGRAQGNGAAIQPSLWLFDAFTFSTGVFVEAGVVAGAPTTSEAAIGVSFGSEHARVASDNRIDFGAARGATFGDLAVSLEDDALGGSIRARASFAWGTAAFNRLWFGLDRDAIDFAAIELAYRRSVLAPLYLEPHAQWTTLLPPLRANVVEPTLFVAGLALGLEL
jgi:hypothetical protein